MKKCCGHLVTTPFCPHCGRQCMESSPFLSLLSHCRSTARTMRADANNWSKMHPDSDIAIRRIGQAEKWESWVAALESLVAAQGKKDQKP